MTGKVSGNTYSGNLRIVVNGPPRITGTGTFTLEKTDVISSITVEKTANPISVEEPGGNVDFTVKVTNTSSVDTIKLTTIADDENNDGKDDKIYNATAICLTTSLAPAESTTCSFSHDVTGEGGEIITDKVTVSGTDDEGDEVSASDTAEVAIKSLICVAFSNQAITRTRQVLRHSEDIYVPNQLIVRYKKPEGLTSLQSLVTTMESTYGYHTLSSGNGLGPDLIEIIGDVESTATRLNGDPNVIYAEPNGYLDPLVVIPNDPLFEHQWNMQDFGLPQAWEIETGDTKTGNAPIVIAILDSAVQTDHEDLKDKMLPGCDFHDNDNDPSSPNINNFHGTHVAGIAAAVGNNNLGVAGVAFGKEIKILPVKIFDDTGTNGNFFDLANAIRWSVGLNVASFASNPNPAKILNMSLGAAGRSLALDEAIADATNAGALVFAASGNAGLSNAILTPANAPDAIAVGSVDSDFERSSFSNFDETGGKTVDFVGPGGFLKTDTVANCVGVNSSAIFSTFPVNNYNCLAGTSTSTPFVSGVAALVWNQNPNFSAEQVKTRLEQTTFFDPSWGNGKSFEHGFGVVCADRALGGTTLCGK